MNVSIKNSLAQYGDEDIRIEKNQFGVDTYIFDPYNPLNKMVSKEEIESFLSSYGINVPINNFELFKRAFVHRSYIKRPNLENEKNNIIIVPKPDDCLPLYTKSNEPPRFNCPTITKPPLVLFSSKALHKDIKTAIPMPLPLLEASNALN